MPAARSSFKMDSIIYIRILRNWEIGQNIPSKYATRSNVRYAVNVLHSERGSAISDYLVFIVFLGEIHPRDAASLHLQSS